MTATVRMGESRGSMGTGINIFLIQQPCFGLAGRQVEANCCLFKLYFGVKDDFI